MCADSHDAAGDRNLDAVGRQLLCGLRVVLAPDLRESVRGAVVAGIGRLSQRCDLLELLLPERELGALKL